MRLALAAAPQPVWRCSDEKVLPVRENGKRGPEGSENAEEGPITIPKQPKKSLHPLGK